MKNRIALGVVVVLMISASHDAWAQKKVLTAAYLKASISAIDDRSTVSILGEYRVDPGMAEAKGRGLRNKGFSRFSIRDPRTGAIFTSMYCKQESDVFWKLLRTRDNTRFTFRGEKGRGENREGAIFVDRLENVLLPPKVVAERVAGTEPVKNSQFRVIITNAETGVRTVLTRVDRGVPVRVDSLTILIEDEPTPVEEP